MKSSCKQSCLVILALAGLLTLASCKQTKDDIANPDIQVDTSAAPSTQILTVKDSLSWAYGQYLALTMKELYFDTAINRDIALEAFAYTIKDGSQNRLTDQQAWDISQYALMQYSMTKRSQAKSLASSVDSLQILYFDNLVKTNPNVKRFDMGEHAFYYEVLQQGKGPNAEYAQRIKFDYRSYNLLNGNPIDQTYERRPPIVYVVGSPMFPALIEAFQLMNAGSVYRFYFPYQLAFGAEGADNLIPPYTPVVYEIELHELYDI